jgi:hypothetical protein
MAAEILTLGRLPEMEYFQPEETRWMRALLRTTKEREFNDTARTDRTGASPARTDDRDQ